MSESKQISITLYEFIKTIKLKMSHCISVQVTVQKEETVHTTVVWL